MFLFAVSVTGECSDDGTAMTRTNLNSLQAASYTVHLICNGWPALLTQPRRYLIFDGRPKNPRRIADRWSIAADLAKLTWLTGTPFTFQSMNNK